MAKKKPGKYDEIIHTLKAAEPEDPSSQEKVNKIKDARRQEAFEKGKPEIMSPEGLAKDFMIFRGVKDDLEGQLKVVQEQLTAVEQLLDESCKNADPGWGLYGAGPTTVKLPNGSSVRLQYEPVAKVINKEEFRLWCIANGLENSLQLWPSTMQSIVKGRLVNFEELPDGVEAFSKAKFVRGQG